MTGPPFANGEVAARFEAFDPPVRERLLALRALIFEVANTTQGVGPLEETLKWGQLSYLTARSRSGTTIRISTEGTPDADFALYVSCNSSLVENWRTRYPALLFGGNRSLLLRLGDEIDTGPIRHCIALALTYHVRKKSHGRKK